MDLFKPYKKSFEYSYTQGAFPTFELINSRPELVNVVYSHSSFTDYEKLERVCKEKNITLKIDDKMINKLSEKENVFVVGIFKKYICELEYEKPHLVLVNPSNMGNLGTIIRTALGFEIKDIAVIEPGVDFFNPKVIRASMGAIFHVNIKYYASFDEYAKSFGNHEFFTFMLDGDVVFKLDYANKPKLYSLIFGNEATGLDASFKSVGTSLFIPQSNEVDSLNLTIAAGIGMYVFRNK